MAHEPLSPELVLVDPELGARARAALPDRVSPTRPRRPATTPPSMAAPLPAHADHRRPYPIWARVTAALWLLVIGILIGGAAIPHAQDQPRVVPTDDDVPATICELPQGPATPSASPASPGEQP